MWNHAGVLGINFGHVGFLADSGRDGLAAALGRIARGETQAEERSALTATVQAEPSRRLTAQRHRRRAGAGVRDGAAAR